MKKVLIIGNGFDLHHNLPTKWIDFKKFIESERKESELKNSCKTLLIWIDEIILILILIFFILVELEK